MKTLYVAFLFVIMIHQPYQLFLSYKNVYTIRNITESTIMLKHEYLKFCDIRSFQEIGFVYYLFLTSFVLFCIKSVS